MLVIYIYISSPFTFFFRLDFLAIMLDGLFGVGRMKCVVDTRNGWPVYAAASRSLCLCGMGGWMVLYIIVIYIFSLILQDHVFKFWSH